MTISQSPSSGTLSDTIRACIENGTRLLEETYDLELRQPPSTRFFLSMIAQEEFEKAFIIILVEEGIIPLTPSVERAMRDHACKQLIGLTMDYMIMHWENIDELKAAIKRDIDLDDRLPCPVSSALNLFRHEKIGRWESNAWIWQDEPSYEASALRIYKGKEDRRKQSALYVDILSDGGIRSTPQTITEKETKAQLERAGRFKDFVISALSEGMDAYRYNKVIAAFKILFESQHP